MAEAVDFRITSVEQLRGLIGDPYPVVKHKLWSALDETAIDFIRHAPFLVLGTADAGGNLDVSPKGDEPGFVAVEDSTTLMIPDRAGNKLIMSLQNILANPQVGIIFMVPGTDETLRVNGTAELTVDPGVLNRLAARGKMPQVAIRVSVRECFFHCAKAFRRSQLWNHQNWPAPVRVSFGKMLTAKMGGDETLARQIDAQCEADYKTNL
ncbi:MAG TPA: MSMEG_1061 family FMN-dependent PPOX-type flavoprotein [Candidatus Binataceae bacterium]|nr:MSMEG_1061 family FMN-dependent PPOX-type flavoprotein [Candidatus Binataceae bacterium]